MRCPSRASASSPRSSARRGRASTRARASACRFRRRRCPSSRRAASSSRGSAPDPSFELIRRGPRQRGLRAFCTRRRVDRRTYVRLSSPPCSWPSTRPTGWSSSSRSGGGRSPPRRPPARSSRSHARRPLWRGPCVGLAAPPGRDLPLEAARFVVVDLETTGLRPALAGIVEIGAVRVEALPPAGTFQTFVDPGVPLPAVVAGLTGIADRDLRGAPGPGAAVSRFLAFAGSGAVIVAHNARFDLAFLDREVERLTGRRLAASVVDTVGLARRLLGGRVARVGLASLAHFFGTSVRPCHRALPDAQATAEILVALVGLAQERGARTVADLVELAAPRRRRVYEKRSLVFGAPTRPGVYLFHDARGQVLYVGRARDLRARLRSYFRSERQRPAVEAALSAVERVEWRVLGSELEAALEELRLIRELRPPARLRDRVQALEALVRELADLERLRTAELCLLVPALQEGSLRAFFVARGRVASARTLPAGGGALVEIPAGIAEAHAAEPSLAPQDADELHLLGSFLRRPPPELVVLALEEAGIAAACDHPWPRVA